MTMDSTSLAGVDLIQLSILIVLTICGAVITRKSLAWMKTNAKVSDALNIPTFSDQSDWESVETQKKLTDAFEKYGCCYYKINKSNQELYNSIYPQIMSVFERTLRDDQFVETLPKLRSYQSSSINYGYLDSYRKLSQARSFVIPFERFENNTNFMDSEHNPFSKNAQVAAYAKNMSEHCQLFLRCIVRSYLNKNGFNLDVDEQMERLIGNNPQKHLRFNYYDPLVSKDDKHSKDIHGVKPHADYGFLTFLQPSGPGFQILFKGKWINVPYYEDRFCVNVGKALSTTTNGQFKAVRHTVPIIEDKPRVSVAFFYDPDLSGNLYQYQSDGALKVVKDFQTYFYKGSAMKSYKRYQTEY